MQQFPATEVSFTFHTQFPYALKRLPGHHSTNADVPLAARASARPSRYSSRRTSKAENPGQYELYMQDSS